MLILIRLTVNLKFLLFYVTEIYNKCFNLKLELIIYFVQYDNVIFISFQYFKVSYITFFTSNRIFITNGFLL